MRNEGKPWTTREEEYLLNNYGVLTMHSLMKYLGRSKEAIERKHIRLTGTISTHIAGGYYSPPQIAEAIGVNRRTVTNWIHHYDLPASQKTIVHSGKKKNLRYAIDPIAFWKWAKANRERIRFEYVQEGIILPEPKWLAEEISLAKRQPTLKPPTWWTEEEKRKAWDLYMLGDNYEKISEYLSRPIEGVKEMINKLKRKQYEDLVLK